MKFKHKLGYMLIGCLFTIAGYILASAGYILASPQVGAKHAQKDVIDKIVCRQLEVVNKEGITVARIYNGGIELCDLFGNGVVGIYEDVDGNGSIEVNNSAGDEVVDISVTAADGNGSIEVRNAIEDRNAIEKKAVYIFGNEDGGVLIVYNAAGDAIAGIIVNKDGDGIIESYNGDWRTKGIERK